VARRRQPLSKGGKVVRSRIISFLSLSFVAASLSGCAAPACLSFLPITGSAYEGYVVWKSGEATKYYAFDLDTTYRAVLRTAEQLKLESAVTKSAPKEGYSLETKGTVPMHIDIVLVEKSITSVVISISTFGDKHYVELFYRTVDDNLPKNAAVGREKTK
jgi:hypothetical protein